MKRVTSNRARLLRMLAPYLSVGIFWFGFGSAWLAILGYHAQVLFWVIHDRRWPRFTGGSRFLLGTPLLAAGPLLYLLLPHVTRVDLDVWLSGYGLEGAALVLLVPYFGILHPVLEQIHWAPLRERSRLSHALFAGYHLLVLGSLLEWPYLVLVLALLFAASQVWASMTRKGGGLAGPIVSHVGADLGFILAALLRSSGG